MTAWIYTHNSQGNLDVLNHPGEVQEANNNKKQLQRQNDERDEENPSRGRSGVEAQRLDVNYLSPRCTQSYHCAHGQDEY